ncbi:DNA-binding protein HU-beta [Dysgonomonadaceae bacterium PH5-43]|nr:DNA-binding protein HU-beta [Dysgonomonadaceae bacterium PH5-43]
MNFSDFTTELSKRLQVSKTEVEKRVNATAAIVQEQLLEENVITYGNLGTFEVKKRDERIGVNPSNGKKLLIPPKLLVKYKASHFIKEKLKEMKL